MRGAGPGERSARSREGYGLSMPPTLAVALDLALDAPFRYGP